MDALTNDFTDWHLRGDVFGDFTDINESADGLFHFNHCIWLIFLHIDVEGKFSIVKKWSHSIANSSSD